MAHVSRRTTGPSRLADLKITVPKSRNSRNGQADETAAWSRWVIREHVHLSRLELYPYGILPASALLGLLRWTGSQTQQLGVEP